DASWCSLPATLLDSIQALGLGKIRIREFGYFVDGANFKGVSVV
ncbi:MAG: hypothetical protein ACI87H_003842, partial [Gammaproteobacteria bacterium]